MKFAFILFMMCTACKGNDMFTLPPSDHQPVVLCFDKTEWRQQLVELMERPFYNDAGLYTVAEADYSCAFHPPKKYDKNPSQLWIGRPADTVTISYTPGVTIRLPDRYFGLFLVYAMDHYGLNPSMLVGLAAKESFLTAIYATDDRNYFLVDDENAHFDCYSPSRNGLCTDGNRDGPFQVENPAMCTDVSAIPYRFYTGDQAVPKAERTPAYLSDNEFLLMDNFRQFHDLYTLDLGRAVVLTALDFHFRHTLMTSMKKMGFYDAMARRPDRNSKDSLEFCTAMYTYNRGIFDTQIINMLAQCDETKDPVDCGFDGYGGHSADIRKVCKLLDSTPESLLYDYAVNKDDVAHLLDTLEWVYPYDKVEPFHGHIDWAQIRSDVKEAFELILAKRRSVSGTKYGNGISFRYDLRALVAVLRMGLPTMEALAGPSVKGFVDYWGTTKNPSLGPTSSPGTFPVDFCALAGWDENLCSDDTCRARCKDVFAECAVEPGADKRCDCLIRWSQCMENTGCKKGLTCEVAQCMNCDIAQCTTCPEAVKQSCKDAFHSCVGTKKDCNCAVQWGECMEDGECMAGVSSQLAQCDKCRDPVCDIAPIVACHDAFSKCVQSADSECDCVDAFKRCVNSH